MPEASSWLVWQLADSAFPSGGFAHSGGLEASWQLGELRTRDDLSAFARASLGQLAHGLVPFLLGVHRDPDRWIDLDERCDVFLNNHVANRASRCQGQAFLAVVRRNLSGRHEADSIAPEKCHLAPALGWITRTFGMDEEVSVRLYLYVNLRGLVSAAVRLGVVGPMEGQRLQQQWSEEAERVAQSALTQSSEEAWQTAPLLDLFQGTQDRLYSRLFQS